MNTEQKMKALRMCCDDDSVRITLAEPFLYDLDGRKVAVATDARVLIMFYNPDGLDIRDDVGLNIKQVMIKGDDEGILDVERFRRAYEALPRLPYIKETCPECGGEGEVKADYCDRNGVYFLLDAECPVCGGDGMLRKAGTSIDHKSAISLCGEAVSAKYSERLAELLTVLDNPKDLRLSVVNGNGLRRVILQNDEVYIIIMSVAITDETDIKIVNY